MKIRTIILVLACIFASCASGTNEKLDEARFALDSGDFDTAISKAGSVLTGDRANVEAALLLASAHAGSTLYYQNILNEAKSIWDWLQLIGKALLQQRFEKVNHQKLLALDGETWWKGLTVGYST